MTILLDEIAAMDADIVCLQELDEVHYHNDFGTKMGGLGYKGVYSKRQSSFAHGFAVFYRIGRITVVKALPVPCPEKVILSEIEHAGLLLVLDFAYEGKVRRVCVGTTHLVCNRTRGFRKLGQLMALISAAKAMMKKDPTMALGDFNAQAGSLLTDFVVRGSVDLSSMPEEKFSSRPLGRRRMGAVDEQHLEDVKTFKKKTWELRDLASPKPLEFPMPRCSQNCSLRQGDFVAPVVSTFAPKVDELRHMARTYKDLENEVVGHPLHMSSVYGAPNIPDFIFYGQLMGCRPRLELVARLELPKMLVQLKAGLPAAYLGSDHYAIGAKYRFKDLV
ncbi:Protein angel 2 [Mortierella alpina]|nr:Protein angel 2 [Mortierella alpina]